MSNSNSKNSPVVVITGCTGVGKTALSIELSRMLKNTEIVSCDSMAVYKEMNIGIAKPGKKVRDEIPHHLIDVVSVKEDFDAAKYVAEAGTAVSKIAERGHLPVIVGGSVMYLYSLLDGIFKGPGKDLKLRDALKKGALKQGTMSLYHELEKIDPDAAVKIHPNDFRRVARAIEVHYKTGGKISELKGQKKGIYSCYDITIYAVLMNRAKIYDQINSRVDEMINQGLLDEVKNIWNTGMSLTAYQAHGYKEIIAYLEGEYDFNEAIRLIKRNTRRFAKRQLSWLKRDKRIRWINLDDFDSIHSAAEFIVRDLRL